MRRNLILSKKRKNSKLTPEKREELQRQREREKKTLEAFIHFLEKNSKEISRLAHLYKQEIFQKIVTKISTEKIYVIVYHGPFYEHQELSAENYEDCIADFDRYFDPLDEEYGNDYNINNFYSSILDKLILHDNQGYMELCDELQRINPNDPLDKLIERFRMEIHDILEDYCEDAIDELIWPDFDVTKDFFIDCICNNPNYSKLHKELEEYKGFLEEQEKLEQERILRRQRLEEEERQKKLFTQQQLIQRIPDHPKELYPLARSIKRNFILHIGPTNSGKTYHALKALMSSKCGIYLAPLRLLAYEVYETLNSENVPCSMITGEEEKITENAKHVSCTIEMLNTEREYQTAVIDEAQLIGDVNRGGSWTRAILGLYAHEIHICMAPEAENIIIKLIEDCQDTYQIKRYERKTELLPSTRFKRNATSVEEYDALIVFSKIKVLQIAAELQHNHIPCSILYGALPYEVRQNEVNRFVNGETKVVVATDCIGMGMNLPIKRVVFLEHSKFDGKKVRPLSTSEIKQIAGRAGRTGIFEKGYYSSTSNVSKIQQQLLQDTPLIEKASLDFDKALLQIDAPLRQIMHQWKKLPDKGDFQKVDISQILDLCNQIHLLTDDKKLIYDFITMPFDTRNIQLLKLWKDMFHKELCGEHLIFKEPDYIENNIDSLEYAYKYCDLFFYYAKRFSPFENINYITDCKKNISDRLSKLLVERNLKRKVCRDCGSPLPWLYEYPICQDCYIERRSNYNWY